MSTLIDSLRNYAIVNYGIIVFTPSIALEVIDKAEKEGLKIWGIDAFTLKLNHTQPWMEHSINLEKRDDGGWEAARQHIISKRHLDLFFEICVAEKNEESRTYFVPMKSGLPPKEGKE